MWSLSLVMTECTVSECSQYHVSIFYIVDLVVISFNEIPVYPASNIVLWKITMSYAHVQLLFYFMENVWTAEIKNNKCKLL